MYPAYVAYRASTCSRSVHAILQSRCAISCCIAVYADTSVHSRANYQHGTTEAKFQRASNMTSASSTASDISSARADPVPCPVAVAVHEVSAPGWSPNSHGQLTCRKLAERAQSMPSRSSGWRFSPLPATTLEDGIPVGDGYGCRCRCLAGTRW